MEDVVYGTFWHDGVPLHYKAPATKSLGRIAYQLYRTEHGYVWEQSAAGIMHIVPSPSSVRPGPYGTYYFTTTIFPPKDNEGSRRRLE